MVEQPDGKRTEGMSQEIELSPELHGGVNIKSHAVLGVYGSGVHWVDVFLDGKLFTRMPLNVVLTRTEGATPNSEKKS